MLEDPQGTGVRPGDVLAGKYRVEKVLGVGGMGVVVAAHHLVLDERVALKFLLPEMLRSPEAVARFVREARAAAKIKSEHVVRVSDVGQLENGSPYIVMEFLEGGDLADWIKENGALPSEQAVDFLLQACVAVADAHALGIVHRDLKPANLFCVRRLDGQLVIKVLDFGISKMTNVGAAGSGFDVTKTAAFMGSPLYMSPEQMSSAKSVDPQSDIWALGVILYELLAGQVPFTGDTMTEVVVQVTGSPPPPLRTFRPDVSPALEAAILKCLEKERANRYRNVGELALALAAFAPLRSRPLVERITATVEAAGLSGGARPPVRGATPVVNAGERTALVPGTSPGVSHTRPSAPPSGHRRAGFLLVGALATCTAALGALGLRGSSASPPAARNVAAAPSLTGAAIQAPAPPPPVVDEASIAATSAPPDAESAPATRASLSAPPARPVAAASAKPPRPTASARAGAPPKPPATPACTATSYFGADGETHWKQICN